jgi:hypothetical protein
MSADIPCGFQGLASLVSDVSTDITDAERLAHFPQPTPPAQAVSPPHDTPVIRARLGKLTTGAKVALAIVIGFTVIWLFGLAQELLGPASVPTQTTSSPPASEPLEGPAPQAPPSSLPLDLNGTRPPVGTGLVLDADQIRYCLVEDIRLTAISPIVDTRSAEQVNRYNARLTDLNSRCASFRYRRGSLERVRAEVEAQRATLEGLARRQWRTER